MKGLLRNNMYSVWDSFKLTLLFHVLVSIAITVAEVYYSNVGEYILVVIVSQMSSFAGLSATSLQQDIKYKWNKFEITMPVTRREVTSARYTLYLIFAALGFAIASITIIGQIAVGSEINWERVLYGVTLGLTFALLFPALLYPLNLILGDNKSEISFMVAMFLGLGLFIGANYLFTPLLNTLENPNLVFRVASLIFSAIIFIVSYFLSIWIYEKKEL